MTIQIELMKTQYKSLTSRNYYEKGSTIEYIAKKILEELGVEKIYKITDIYEQYNLGDYFIFHNGKKKTIEVKTSHVFKNVDKLAMDFKYFKQSVSDKLVPYVQKNTKTNLGWLIDNKADILLSFNPVSNKAYIISNFPEVSKNILADVKKYIATLKNGELTRYRNNHNNYINEFLEGSVKVDNRLKITLIINLTLNYEAIEHYGGNLQILNIEIIKGKNRI